MDRLADFIAHLDHGRGVSEHTRIAYESDLEQFGTWLKELDARSGQDRCHERPSPWNGHARGLRHAAPARR